MKQRRIRENGFTAIEIIAVLLLVGILSAFAASRITSTQTYSLAVEEHILKTHLRYAHLRALSDDTTWGMRFEGGSYTLQRDGADAPYNLPNEDSVTHALPDGITVSGNTVTYDEWGNPGTAENITIILSSGGESKEIIVTKNTGFIQ